MSRKNETERQKQIQEKCQMLLTKMLRDDDNKYCVDCDAKGPRWASWNLGVFLCIRCAGIHRNLGVHISRVKSVNLDSWTPEQVVSNRGRERGVGIGGKKHVTRYGTGGGNVGTHPCPCAVLCALPLPNGGVLPLYTPHHHAHQSRLFLN